MKYNKERLFEVMQRVDPSFKPKKILAEGFNPEKDVKWIHPNKVLLNVNGYEYEFNNVSTTTSYDSKFAPQRPKQPFIMVNRSEYYTQIPREYESLEQAHLIISDAQKERMNPTKDTIHGLISSKQMDDAEAESMAGYHGDIHYNNSDNSKAVDDFDDEVDEGWAQNLAAGAMMGAASLMPMKAGAQTQSAAPVDNKPRSEISVDSHDNVQNPDTPQPPLEPDNTTQQQRAYQFMVGYTNHLQSIAKEKGDMNYVNLYTEISNYYIRLIKGDTPKPLSSEANKLNKIISSNFNTLGKETADKYIQQGKEVTDGNVTLIGQ